MFGVAVLAMVTFPMTVALAQTAATDAEVAPAPEIIVEGKAKPKPKLVCTTTRITGSRVARSRRCVTQEQAAEEAQRSREAIRQGATEQHSREALACGPGTMQSCN
jgi:hypothetical protein